MSNQRQPFRFVLMALILAILITTSTLAAFASPHHASTDASPILPRGDANPADLPDPGPVSSDDLRRGPGGPWLDGPYTYYCGIFNTGMPHQIRSGSMSLRVVNITYAAPPKSCLRVYCYDTSAIYLCNDNPTDTLTIPGYNIGWMADRLSALCCDSHHGTSAQLFHPTEHWNTIVAYGNCRHDPEEPPSSFGTSNGGVNGECIPNASRPSPGGPS